MQTLLLLSVCGFFFTFVNGQSANSNPVNAVTHKKLVKHCEAKMHERLVYPQQYFQHEMDDFEYQTLMDIVTSNNREWEKLLAYERYYHPEDFEDQYNNFGSFGCKDICRTERRMVGGVYLTFHDDKNLVNLTYPCFVVGNQRLFYSTCGGKRVDFHNRRLITGDFRCLQDDVVYRDALVVCPDVVPQCHVRTFALPQSCTLNQVICKTKRAIPPPPSIGGRDPYRFLRFKNRRGRGRLPGR